MKSPPQLPDQQLEIPSLNSQSFGGAGQIRTAVMLVSAATQTTWLYNALTVEVPGFEQLSYAPSFSTIVHR